MIGSRLVTPQTGQEGKLIRKVLVEEAAPIVQEMYLGITIDRGKECPVIIASREGGVEIEELARRSPEKIVKERVHPSVGLRPFQVSKMFFSLDLDASLRRPVTELIHQLHKLFMEKDCSLVEINPLVVTEQGQLLALDGKLNFDDNALYRHEEVVELRDAGGRAPGGGGFEV